MLGTVFALMVLFSVVGGAFCGTLPALADAVLDGAARAVTLTLSLGGMMCLFGGVMRVFSAAGVLDFLAKCLSPLLRLAFPDAYKRNNGTHELSANVAANLLGIGNAATPFALAAMEKLQENNGGRDTASDDMVTLATLNCAPPNLLPTTLIALRRTGGSLRAAAILLPVWLVSLVCAWLSVLLSRLLSRHFKPNIKRKDGQAENAGIPLNARPSRGLRGGGGAFTDQKKEKPL